MLRWIHKGWKTFWTIVLSFLIIVIVLVGGVLAALQLDATKDVIAEKLENSFKKNYNGRLSIGQIGGILPFNTELEDVVLTSSADSLTADTLITVKSAQIGIDYWALLQSTLSINEFQLHKPDVRLIADGSGGYTLKHALQKKKKKAKKKSSNGLWIKKVEIVAPKMSISDGSFFVEKLHLSSEKVGLPEPLRIDDIDASLYLELTGSKRFAEMEHFSANIAGLKAGDVGMSGQVYNDDQTLEFNGFHFMAGSSQIDLNGTIEGINLYKSGLESQFRQANYDIKLTSNRLQLSEFADVLSQLPDINEPLDFNIQTKGTLQALKINTFRLGLGKSYLSINGSVDQLLEKKRLAYRFNIDTLAVRKKDLEVFTDTLNANQYQAVENLHLNGRAEGNLDSLQANISGNSTLGSFHFDGHAGLKKPHTYRGQLTGQEVNIGPLSGAEIDTTSLNFKARVSGQNSGLTTGWLNFEGLAKNSFINNTAIDSLRLSASLEQGHLNTTYHYRNKAQTINGKAKADFTQKDPPITLNGSTRRLNLANFVADTTLDSTSINTNYSVDMKGVKPDRMQGIARFEVEKSTINGDSVRAHHIQVKLDSPDLPSRTFTVNSSLFDLKMTGDLKPTRISDQVTYWSNYFKSHIAREVRFDSLDYVPKRQISSVKPINVKGHFEAKDLNLVRQYWPSFPSLVTNSTGQFSINADNSDLQFSSDITSDTLRINTVQVKGAGSKLSGHFHHDESLKQSGQFQLQTTAGRIESNLVKMDSVDINLNYRHDSLYYAQHVKRFSNDARFNLEMSSKLAQRDIKVNITQFFLGNNNYAWQNVSTPKITFNKNKKFIFNNFKFKNDNEYFALKGELSPDRSDSLQTIIRNVSLARVSHLIKGKFNFSGRLNGQLQTRSLTKKPSIQGELKVDSLKLQNRLVGDLRFTSKLNETKDRFDTKLKIITDSTKYNQYLAANNGVGQDILIDGYIKPTELSAKKDSAFYFDTHFNEIDMWLVQLITQNVFTQLEGRADGNGYISGNLNQVNYNVDFNVHHVYARPDFLKTNYYLDGHVKFSRKEGVVFDDISIKDKHGGTGSLSGTIDLNDFKPISYFDLRMKLNDLRFMNSSYHEGEPFFGTMSGSGALRLYGSNTNMNLNTTSDIRVNENSNLSIPLLEETELNSNNKFIRFVKSFKNPERKEGDSDINKNNLGESALRRAVQDLSFSERFNLDLQFEAPDPIDVRLIFDPVTQERMRARGTGRMRISMNEGELQIFGHYNVSGGSYQFVSGEIFSRKLDIKPGGNIVWEGPPDDARLNVEAVYHARPDPATLRSTDNDASSDNNNSASQRVPIDLVVEVSGTLNNIQNDYHFEIPNSFNLNSSTLKYTINQINSDKQQKLLQATSILLTGNFLPTGGGGSSQTNDLRKSLTKSSTFINPLLSNQVISPLLSDQINSLLNSDVSQFDIDFKLNRYNQIDLGIALRLYNDKLIFRREGYLTGGGNSESSFGERIGDLKVTYRINKGLSLNAFHRQDQSYGTILAGARANNLTPTVNGAGIEAQVQFNTWQELSHKVTNFFRRLVGKEEIDFRKKVRRKERNNEEEKDRNS